MTPDRPTLSGEFISIWSVRVTVLLVLLKTISYNQKPDFFINAESIFIEIFVPKLKSVLIGILNRPPDKYDL